MNLETAIYEKQFPSLFVLFGNYSYLCTQKENNIGTPFATDRT